MTWTYDREAFSIRGGARLGNLHNVYATYGASAAQARAGVLDAWIALVTDRTKLPERFADAREHLLPMLRASGEASQASLRAGPGFALDHVAFIDRPLSFDAVLSIVFDSPQFVSRVPRERLSVWGVPADEVWSAALDTLRADSPDAWTRAAPGVFRYGRRDSFDATRLIVTDLVARVPVAGRRLAMIPERSALFVAGEDDPEALAAMVRAALAIYDETPYKLIPDVLVLDAAGAWSPYVLPAPGLRHEIAHRKLADRHRAYAEQTALLQPRYGDDVLVAPFIAVAGAPGTPARTYATWAPFETLLPEVDFVLLPERPDEVEPLAVTWDALAAAAGPLEAMPGLVPPRYRLPARTAAHDARLRAVAFASRLHEAG